MGAKLREIIILIRIIYMPQFDEISPLNEICALAFKKKKKKISIQTNKRGVKKKTKNRASSLINTIEALPVSFN